MEAKVFESLQLPSLVYNSDIEGWRPSFSLNSKQIRGGENCWKNQTILSRKLRVEYKANRRSSIALNVSCSSQNVQASVLQTESIPISLDEAHILQKQSEKVEPYLNGRCIYFVGMMGSGKTTVGKVLAEVLGYSFFDCDTLIEQSVGGTSVAEIFKLYGETFFRDNETEVLHKLSSMQRLVVSTGGGAVVRPINWKYMHMGISVWLDVPLEALARRIASVGTDSRPLLHGEAGDAYTKAFKRLSALTEERGDAYANANARVSFENVAMKMGCEDVYKVTPTAIAIEALIQIEDFLKKQ